MQPDVDDLVDERLAEPDHKQRYAHREDDAAEPFRSQDVPDAERHLVQEVVLGRRRPLLPDIEQRQTQRRRAERHRVQDRDAAGPEGRQQPGADQRGDQPEPLGERLQQAVHLAEALGREDDGEQGRLAGLQDGARQSVEERDHVDQPHLFLAADEQQQKDRDPDRDVDHDHQRPATDPVDQDAERGRHQVRERQDEEEQAGGGAAPGELLHPDAEPDEHDAIAEDGERRARHHQPRVVVSKEVPQPGS